MSDGVQRYLGVASDLTRSTLGMTERAVAQFVRQGEVAADHAERLVDELLARSVEGSGAVAQIVRQEVERAIARAGFVRREELDALRREVDALRRGSAAPGAPAEPAPVMDAASPGVGEEPAPVVDAASPGVGEEPAPVVDAASSRVGEQPASVSVVARTDGAGVPAPTDDPDAATDAADDAGAAQDDGR